jgi:FkbM family methyltransferase
MLAMRVLQKWLAKRDLYVARGLPYTLSWQLRALFAAVHVNCVIDVGAHHGEFGQLMRQSVAYDGRLASFEPSSANYQRLVTIASGDTEWLTFPFGLGANAAKATISVYEESVFNSLLPATDFARTRFGNGVRQLGVEEVEVRTLDDCISDCTVGIEQPAIYLKLDTQGYDQRVLHGGRKTLSNVVALQSEIAVRHLYEGAPDFLDALQGIVDLGFTPVGFFPVAKETDNLRVIEFDAVAVRTILT